MVSFTRVQKHNTRPATCRRCRRSLAAGMGFGWRLEGENLVNSPVMYLCARCTQAQAEEEQALAESADALDVIGAALQFNAPLNFIDEKRVREAIARAGANAPARAREIAGRIELGESFNVWEVVRMISG